MDETTHYEIRVEGYLSKSWSDWFAGLDVDTNEQGQTSLRGALPDQAALFGVLARVHALNLTLVSLKRVVRPQPGPPGTRTRATS